MVSADTVEKAVALIRKGYAQYEYFFESLRSAEWVEPLRQKGFFRTPPGIERRGDSQFWLRWPESRYLQRVAPQDAQAVAAAFLNMEQTENPFVHADLVDAALKMPGPLAADLSRIEREWVERNEHFGGLSAHDLGKLMAHLARTGEKAEALRLAAALLSIIPDPRYVESQEVERYPEGMEFLGLPQPRTKLDTWFQHILREDILTLVDSVGLEAIAMLADLLSRAISLSSLKSNEEKPYDYSTIWFPALDKPDRHATSQIKHPLAVALRDGALQHVSGDIGRLDPCIREIEAREWHICIRICLNLLAENWRVDHNLVREHVLDRRLLDEYPFENEYFLLLRRCFCDLQADEQETVVSWIKEGPQHLREDAFRDEQEKARYIKIWVCQRLHLICEHLPETGKATYLGLLSEVGDAGTEDLAAHRFSRSWVGPTSPLSSNEIDEMSDDQLLAFLRDWKEPEGWAVPSPEGLSRVLSGTIEKDPARFCGLAPRLRGYEPTYVRGILHGFEQAARIKKPFDWEAPLTLARWVIQTHGSEPDRAQASGDRDPGWCWTRKTIASLLGYGFHDNEVEIPFRLRQSVWELLATLCEDPDPTLEQDAECAGSQYDAADRSLNVTRGQALHSTVGYVLWVRHNLERDSRYSSKTSGWIDEMPEAREVLERHLDPIVDPSSAVRSVYGHWYPQLMWLDRQWASGLSRRIFGGPTTRDELQRVAWNTFVVFCRPYRDVFDVLEDVYSLAVSELHQRDESYHRFQPEPRLAEHLISVYAWGALDTDRRRQILAEFFDRAWGALRTTAMSAAAEFAQCAYGEGAEETLDRLRNLWHTRLEHAKRAPTIAEFAGELGEFGGWYASGRFGEEWALEQLAEVLRLTGKVEPGREVARHLARTSEGLLGKALRCLEAMVKGDTEGWGILGWKDEASSLLRKCLESGDSDIRRQAQDFINWLGARGYRDFRGLLA